MTGLVIELRVLLDELRKRGRLSRIQAARDPDYWPHTMAARGLIAAIRCKGDVDSTAVRVVRLLLESHLALVSDDRDEVRIRSDERSRVLASVSDDINAILRHGDESYERLAMQYAAGKMPGDVP